ncbi:MAG: hypothetical protein HeimC3_12070 [Candidatus Heimdallarchaeota archaeon LC_3]|nr:MAG: hypothetical protein HeimC3_12070 [Candidatus Heimdallarchaeota archaeon LC_3]
MSNSENLDVYSFIVKLADTGPEEIAIKLENFIDNEDEKDFFILSQGAYFMTILGQSTQKFVGLFGPLPVREHFDYLSYLFAFELDDDSVKDERLAGKAYCVMALFVHRSEIESINLLRNYLEAALWRYIKNKSISEIDNQFLEGITEVIQLVYNETSVERTDNKIIIRKRIENAITKTEIKQKISGLLEKKKLVIISDSKTDFPMTIEGILGLLAEQIAKYEQKKGKIEGKIDLANGKIEGRIIPSDQVNKKKGEIKSASGLIFTFTSSTKGVSPDNPQISVLKEVLEIISESKETKKIAITIEGEYETSQVFESSVASISSSIPSSLLFANPITFFPISRDFPEKTFELINFLLEKTSSK